MKRVAAIDIGATNTRVALIDEKGNIAGKAAWKTAPRSLVETISNELEKFPPFESIGISAIGKLDIKRGVMVKASNLEVKSFKIVRLLRDRFNVPCYLSNDCIAGVIGERFFGTGRNVKNLVYLTLSTGIGAGIIANDRLVLGKDGNAHDVGHCTIAYGSKLKCGCGGYGHWESFGAGVNIPDYVGYLLRTAYKDKSSKLRHMRRLTTEALFKAARDDSVARKIVDTIGRIDAIGVANTINVYDPELVTIGGSIMLNNSGMLMRQIRRWTGRYAMNRMPRMAVTRLGDDICLLGAAAGALHHEWARQ